MKTIMVLLFIGVFLFNPFIPSCLAADISDVQAYMQSIAGENHEITGDYDDTLAVQCYNGTFVGKQTGDVLSFKGVPFAKQPVGPLRWKAPQAADASDKVYEAYYFGHSPIQTEWASERASYYPQGEDCLNLNVWVNRSDDSADKPVMVFIHGGSFGWGGTSDPLYDAASLSAEYPDVVFVTIGYRTGLWGFIDFSMVEGGEEYPDSGNLGLLDQVCALEWIQDNIEAFGGDPHNVTIWGESAGGASVSLLPLIDSEKGLFHRVISESGAVNQTFSKEECRLQTEMLLEKSGCSSMEELAALDTDTLRELNQDLNDYNDFPERDGRIVPLDPYAAYEAGEAADVAFLIGTNQDECRYWIREVGLMMPRLNELMLYRLFANVLFENEQKLFSEKERAAVDAFMDLQTDQRGWRRTEYFNETVFRLPSIRQAQANAEHGGTVYMYYWKHPSAIPHYGACHAVELSSVFDNMEDTVYTGEVVDSDFAKTVQTMWVNFARTGNPSSDEYTWEPYQTDARKTMILDYGGIGMQSDPLSGQRELLMPVTGHYFHGSYMTMSFATPTVFALAAGLAAIIVVVVLCIVWLIRARKRRRDLREHAENSRHLRIL